MDSYNEQGENWGGCCLDCRWRELRGEFYGATTYWCSLQERTLPPSRLAGQICDQFVDWRTEAD